MAVEKKTLRRKHDTPICRVNQGTFSDYTEDGGKNLHVNVCV
jgi:hypothetical protein